jgi:hypothetical protein
VDKRARAVTRIAKLALIAVGSVVAQSQSPEDTPKFAAVSVRLCNADFEESSASFAHFRRQLPHRFLRDFAALFASEGRAGAI